MVARKRDAGPGDFEPYFSNDERRALRQLLALGPEAIAFAVHAVQVVSTACPTMRRELSDD